jgi:hypothetical protein
MTTNGSQPANGVGLRVNPESSWRSPVKCPAESQPPVEREPAIPATVTAPPRESEAATLLSAYSDANQHLNESNRTLTGACADVVDTYRVADLSVSRLDRFVKTGSTRVARQALGKADSRHANDGPEDRRSRPLWAVILLWPAIIASSIYDTAFIGNTFQRMLSVGEDNPLYYTAYLPGFGIMIGLLVTGHLLGEAVVRRRSRTQRTAVRTPMNPWKAVRRLWQWRPEQERREPDDLPWASWFGPVVFGLAFFGILGVWAFIRALMAGAEHAELAAYGPYMAALLVVLSVAAVALKVITHNPYAGATRRAKKSLRQAKGSADKLLAQAQTDAAAHSQAWLRLQGGLNHAQARARRIIELAQVAILRERTRHGGPENPDLDLGIPLKEPAQTDDDAEDGIDDSIAEPSTDPAASWRLHLEIFGYARRAARRYHPKKLEQRLSGVIDELNGQYMFTDAEPSADEDKMRAE